MAKKNIFLSVCVITKNEERFIDSCLKSIQNIADEIIIVDAFSTDNSKKIALKYNPKFFEREWNNDFSAARNYAISKAKGKWILFIDADEVLVQSKKLLVEIKKNNKNKRVGGFIIEREEKYIQKENPKLIKTAVGITRIFRNHSNIRYQYKIHEFIDNSILKNHQSIKVIKKSKLKHLIYYYKNKSLNKKQAYYLKLLNETLKHKPNDNWILFQKAKTLWFFDEKKEAYKLFIQLSKKKNITQQLKTSALNNAANIISAKGNFYKAKQLLKKSIGIIENQAVAYELLFVINYQNEKYKKAIQTIKKTITNKAKCPYESIMPGGFYTYKEQQLYKLGSSYFAIGKKNKAKTLFKKGIRINHLYADNFYGLTYVYLHERKVEKAINALQKCIKQNPKWQAPKDLLKKIKTIK